ncbi:MAG: DUF1674 domain-containing protein [Kiloniellales bacterium]
MFELFKSHRPRDAKPAKAAPETQQSKRRVSPADLARAEAEAAKGPKNEAKEGKIEELGGPDGPEPTRYGDWERKGICYDF